MKRHTFSREREFQSAVCQLPALVAAKVEEGPTGCWLWTASVKANGYAQFNDGAHNHNAHRLVYSLLVGPIPDGLELDHLCHVRHCVNPGHLEPVTHAENVRRAADRVVQCPQGHPYDDVNTYRWRGARLCRTCRTRRNKERTRVSQ
jgi:hypothetical protein